MNVIIIHGSFGSPKENCFPWLKEELEKLGCKVFVPKFPTPEGQSLQNWLKVFEEYKQYLNEDTVLVGHSLGPAFILNILEELNKPVKTAIFVAGFVGNLNNPKFDEMNKTFTEKEFDWDKIRKNCQSFFVFYSDNDPFVPKERALELARNLGAEAELVRGAGHFNEAAGYTKFPLLLEKIKELSS